MLQKIYIVTNVQSYHIYMGSVQTEISCGMQQKLDKNFNLIHNIFYTA